MISGFSRGSSGWGGFFCALFLLGALDSSDAAAVEISPVSDTSTFPSGAYGAADYVPVSKWDHVVMTFDVSGTSEVVDSAVLRVFYSEGDNIDINLWPLSNDSWSETGAPPAEETAFQTLLGTQQTNGEGYIEFDVTAYVAAERAGDQFASFELSTELGGWRYLASRESSKAPQLVIEGGTSTPVAPPVLTSLSISPAVSQVTVGDSVVFSATGTDQYGTTMASTPTWSVSGGGSIATDGTFSADEIGGPFTVTATDGAVETTQRITVVGIAVVNQKPSASFTGTPASGTAPLVVQFTSTSQDADGQVVATSWNFGDGTSSNAASPSKTFSAAGNFSVVLTVTDNQGAQDSVTQSVSVQAAADTGSGGGSGESTTLAPVQDSATFSGFGTSSSLPVSKWDHSALIFDVSSASTPITSATLRLYYTGDDVVGINLWPLSNDSWSETGAPPAEETAFQTLLGTQQTNGEGYIEFDVTAYVAAERAGDQFASFELSTELGGWRYLASRESSKAPQLVIEGGTSTPVAPPAPSVLASLNISPAVSQVTVGDSVVFSATGTDQYGATMASTPTWSVSGGGSIATDGTFSADEIGGPFTVTATDGSHEATADVQVLPTGYVIPKLVISEIHYHPVEDGFEFIEITNGGDSLVTLDGFAITDGVAFDFPAGATIEPGERIIIAEVLDNYSGNGYDVYQWTSGGLKNSGETVTLSDPFGAIVDSVTYEDEGDWGVAADGYGPSLELKQVSADNADPANWQASSVMGGTPAIVASSSDPVLVRGVITPDATDVVVGNQISFTAQGFDQFDNAIAFSPVWAVDAGGTLDGVGVFTAETLGGPYVVTAAQGSVIGSAEVTVVNQVVASIDLVISEVHYNPLQGDEYEFIELYNNGDHSTDLGGFAILTQSPNTQHCIMGDA